MKTIEDFKKENCSKILNLKKCQGGTRELTTESFGTNWPEYPNGDTETWTYNGGQPVSGTVSPKGSNDVRQLFP